LVITRANVDRFSKFFHWQTFKEIVNVQGGPKNRDHRLMTIILSILNRFKKNSVEDSLLNMQLPSYSTAKAACIRTTGNWPYERWRRSGTACPSLQWRSSPYTGRVCCVVDLWSFHAFMVSCDTVHDMLRYGPLGAGEWVGACPRSVVLAWLAERTAGQSASLREIAERWIENVVLLLRTYEGSVSCFRVLGYCS